MRVVGVEPTLLSEPDFESGASTNSTTPAQARPGRSPLETPAHIRDSQGAVNAKTPPSSGYSAGGVSRKWPWAAAMGFSRVSCHASTQKFATRRP